MERGERRGGPRINSGRPKGAGTRVVRLKVPIAQIARRMNERGFRAGDVNAFLDVDPRSALAIPLMSSRASCGFPSPADDYMEDPIDFNQLIVSNPAATFAVVVAGESMTGAGIFPNDIAVIDRSRGPTHGCVVLACYNGEFTIKRYLVREGVITLKAENPAFPNITIGDDCEFEVWGVLTRSVRSF
ncbi:LexA family protein [Aureimonas phyllosphaerae]|uniref:DNA polymerase V n=1 Tax=Aureimonas phyllosphaerae TaxID=1166078 RepID=A0A7W6FWM1_9HYPH|nr:translesion error-prone DNA polymerase V autoproteolytic subunit [Aureimonas phyllosphaerae]MBB3938070.1 DNA polymerase V [Aureimonas phyllosphaerae]MBB3962054.1 DNA polymerase V [Aureimonas phyllosphaerae]SFF55213.1 SOS response UmuD protein. Serine peptidase. MEROPS family S24 [Aureimonas phyllosphaerae]